MALHSLRSCQSPRRWAAGVVVVVNVRHWHLRGRTTIGHRRRSPRRRCPPSCGMTACVVVVMEVAARLALRMRRRALRLCASREAIGHPRPVYEASTVLEEQLVVPGVECSLRVAHL